MRYNDIRNLFVPRNIAELAKAKGFDWRCLAYYEDDNLYSVDTDNKLTRFRDVVGENVVAPTHQQLIDWFRITHNIAIKPHSLVGHFRTLFQFTTASLVFTSKEHQFESEKHRSYYTALNQILELLLNSEDIKFNEKQ